MSVDARLYEDEVITCPYNKYHRIARSCIQKHLVKCEKNFPPNYLQQCPYDATHRFFACEMQEHIDKCPMKKFWIPQEYSRSPAVKKNMVELKEARPQIVQEETWEEENTDPGFFDTSDSEQEYSECGYMRAFSRNPLAPRRYDVKLRPPRGYSEAMMMELSMSSTVEDMESVTSCQAIGRGITLPTSKRGAAYSMYQRYMLSRGRATKP